VAPPPRVHLWPNDDGAQVPDNELPPYLKNDSPPKYVDPVQGPSINRWNWLIKYLNFGEYRTLHLFETWNKIDRRLCIYWYWLELGGANARNLVFRVTGPWCGGTLRQSWGDQISSSIGFSQIVRQLKQAFCHLSKNGSINAIPLKGRSTPPQRPHCLLR